MFNARIIKKIHCAFPILDTYIIEILFIRVLGQFSNPPQTNLSNYVDKGEEKQVLAPLYHNKETVSIATLVQWMVIVKSSICKKSKQN